MVGYRWTSDSARRAEVAWRRGYGYSLRSIATALGIRYETVSADLGEWAREHPGQPLPGGPQAKRDRRMAAAAQMRAEGMTLRQIAARLGCTEGTVRNDLRRRPANVTLLPRKAPAQERIPGAAITQPDYADVVRLADRKTS